MTKSRCLARPLRRGLEAEEYLVIVVPPKMKPCRFRSGRPADLSEWEIDPTVHISEICEQGDIVAALLSSLRLLIERRGWTRVRAAYDEYFAWLPERPLVRVAPDVFLLDDPPARLPKMWSTWLPGRRAPRWVLEVVSEDWRKDYDQMPLKYEDLGCQELALFDPSAARGETRNARRAALTLYQRTAEGRLKKVYAGKGPVWSRELEVWLLPAREGYSARLRLSEDEAGTRMVPTEEEARHAEAEARHAEAEARHAEAEARLAIQQALDLLQAAREAERTARQRAEEEARAARAALEALKRKLLPGSPGRGRGSRRK